jgi:hypothetical protein
MDGGGFGRGMQFPPKGMPDNGGAGGMPMNSGWGSLANANQQPRIQRGMPWQQR